MGRSQRRREAADSCKANLTPILAQEKMEKRSNIKRRSQARPTNVCRKLAFDQAFTFNEEALRPANSRAVVHAADRKFMSDRSFFVLRQLRTCDRIAPKNDSPKLCGIECMHCQGKHFRRFPESVREVAKSIDGFQVHLEEECMEFPSSLQTKLFTLEQNQAIRGQKKLSNWLFNRLYQSVEEKKKVFFESPQKSFVKRRRMTHSILERI